jgi:phage shock protein PspC (stress-responsive transcriptional regulator)
MQKVISINLNGIAYQLEEGGYGALQDYLSRAQRELKDNPDRAEIMRDLEQAIADKCQRFLGPHKAIVTDAEVTQIVAEMGPVTSGPDAEGSGQNTQNGTNPNAGARSAAGTPKRLYRLTDGAMLAGVCNGIAAYVQVDVTLVRIAFVVLAVLTKGVGILIYVALMFVVSEATTAEARAAAGEPAINAKEIVDRVMRGYEKGTHQWQRQWRRKQRQWWRTQQQWRRAGMSAAAVPPPPWLAAVMPMFGLVHLILFLIAAAMMISLVNTGTILSWQKPPDVPLWTAALVLFLGYQIAVSPFRGLQHWAWRSGGGAAAGWFAFWHAVIWLIGLAVILWVASDHIPEITEFMQRLPHLFREVMYAIRDVVRG